MRFALTDKSTKHSVVNIIQNSVLVIELVCAVDVSIKYEFVNRWRGTFGKSTAAAILQLAIGQYSRSYDRGKM